MKYEKPSQFLLGSPSQVAWLRLKSPSEKPYTVSVHVLQQRDDDTNFNVDGRIDFGFSFDKVSAEVHLQSEDLGDLAVEQVYQSITISAGRI